MKPMIGVFGNEKHLTDALDELYRRDFTDREVKILETPARLSGKSKKDEILMVAGIPGSNNLASGGPPPVAATIVVRNSPEAMREDLRNMGIPGDEVDFCVQRLQHGNRLLILDVDEPRAVQALDILKEAQATNLI